MFAAFMEFLGLVWVHKLLQMAARIKMFVSMIGLEATKKDTAELKEQRECLGNIGMLMRDRVAGFDRAVNHIIK